MSAILSQRPGAKTPWHTGLQPRHWRILGESTDTSTP